MSKDKTCFVRGCNHKFYKSWKDEETNEELDYCIFHAPMEAKKNDTGKFQKAFSKIFKEKLNEFNEVVLNEDKRNIKLDCNFFVFPGINFFSMAHFPFDVDFVGARFEGLTYFNHVQFNGTVSFVDAIFSSPVFFWGTDFHDNVFFDSATFENTVNFRITHFEKKVSFVDSHYRDSVHFQGAYISHLTANSSTIWGKPHFYELYTKSDVIIEGLYIDSIFIIKSTKQKSEIYISNCHFGAHFALRAPFKKISIDHSDFRDSVIIEPNEDKLKKFPEPKVYIHKTSFSDYCKIVECAIREIDQVYMEKITELYKCDITKTIFNGVNLRKFEFENCEFIEIVRPRYRFCWKTLDGLYEDKKAFGLPDDICVRICNSFKRRKGISNSDKILAKKLAEQYRGITANYEERRRHGQAGTFYANELEMRRIYGSWLDKRVLSLFRAVSFYNEDFLTPLFLLVIFIPVIMGSLFAFTGIPTDNGVVSLSIVNPFISKFDPDLVSPILKQICNGIGLAYTALSLAPVQSVRDISGASVIVLILTRISAVILGPTFLFALRRRFKR